MNARVVQALAVAAEAPPAATKAERVELAKNSSVDDALAVVFSKCLKHWTANEAVALSGLDPEGVHEMRVALRRMRAALSDFREIIPVSQVAWLKRDTKWLITSLGTARDWDVFLSELLAPDEAARPRDAGLAKLRIWQNLRQFTSAWCSELFAPCVYQPVTMPAPVDRWSEVP